jgi:protease PrsW
MHRFLAVAARLAAGIRLGVDLDAMSPSDQWYYLDGSESRGPVPSTQIADLIRAGSLGASTLVAQAGWPQWSPASAALAHLLGGAPKAGPGPAPAADQPTYAIRVQCVSGPDAGKAYMIGIAEVSLGRVSGIGQHDPRIADNHVALSWQNNVLRFRTFGGATLRVGGVDVTQGTLSNGQQFQMGASTWQAGSAPVELTNLLSSLNARLNKLTNTEKLEGFSLGSLFSEVFKGRKAGEIDEYFAIGTMKTTPPLEEVQTGWPRPWFFMRVFMFMSIVYLCFYEMVDIWKNPHVATGLMMMGALVVPLTVVILFWELNTPRNVSFTMVLMLLCLGGVISLFLTHFVDEVADLGWMGAAAPGIGEELAKLLAVVLVVRNVKYKYMLNGILFGAAIGAGFAAFETAGYAFSEGFTRGFLASLADAFDSNLTAKTFVHDVVVYLKTGHWTEWLADAHVTGFRFMTKNIFQRGYLAPFGHVVWTAISAGALWRVKGAEKFRIAMLTDPTFVRTFFIPVAMHTLWDTNFVQGLPGFYSTLAMTGIGVMSWYVAFLLVQQGLRQIKDAQVAEVKTQYLRTKDVLTTTGHFRAQTQQ